MRPPQRFAPEGTLALSPQAFGAMFDAPDPAAPVQRDGVAVVQIRGPLMHHSTWCFDSYEAIVSRVAAALEGGPKALVLAIDSPGGLVSGCFETARKLRAMCDSAGIQLAAYVDGQATSAAYALACSARHIAAPQTATIGSIGVLQPLVDATRQAEMFGLKYTMIASGARKTDGHPGAPTSEEAIAATQARVDELGEVFFAFVAEHRGVSSDDVRALEAGIVHGAEAKTRGLIDEVGSMDDLLAALVSTESPAPAGKGGPMAEESDREESAARRALRAIVDDEKATDEDKEEARKALAALDEEETAEEPEPEEEDEEASASAPAATAPAAQAPAPVDVDAKIAAAFRERDEKAERAQLLASRPDLDERTLGLLASAPIAQVREYVKNAPRRALNPAAAAQVRGTVGEGQGDADASPLPAEFRSKMKQIMGLATEERGVFRDGNKIVIGGVKPSQKGA